MFSQFGTSHVFSVFEFCFFGKVSHHLGRTIGCCSVVAPSSKEMSVSPLLVKISQCLHISTRMRSLRRMGTPLPRFPLTSITFSLLTASCSVVESEAKTSLWLLYLGCESKSSIEMISISVGRRLLNSITSARVSCTISLC